MKKCMRLMLVIVALLALGLASTASAETIRVAADSSSGTYAKALGDIINMCNSDELTITPVSLPPNGNHGAVGNLDALLENRADAAFIHSDVYFLSSQSDPAYQALRTLVSLWQEPVHVLALVQSKSAKLGKFNFGKQEFNNLADLKGFKVGAAGGGVLTARVLSGQGRAEFITVDLDKGSNVIPALDNGDIDAAIFVGAAPLPNLEALPKGKYKLLPINGSIADNVNKQYRSTSVKYPNVTNGPVSTIAPLATLLTRKFAVEKRINAQRQFRECFYRQLTELQDTGSRNWLEVSADDRGVLPWLELLSAPASTTKSRK